MGDSTGAYDIEIKQGETFNRLVVWDNEDGSHVDLTGYTAKMQIRKRRTSSDVIIELSTANGRITLGGAAGTITLTISATDTAALDICQGAVYDLELTVGSTVKRLLAGEVSFSREVTQ